MFSPRGVVARLRSQQPRKRHAVQLDHGCVLLGVRELEERRGQISVLRLQHQASSLMTWTWGDFAYKALNKRYNIRSLRIYIYIKH